MDKKNTTQKKKKKKLKEKSLSQEGLKDKDKCVGAFVEIDG